MRPAWWTLATRLDRLQRRPVPGAAGFRALSSGPPLPPASAGPLPSFASSLAGAVASLASAGPAAASNVTPKSLVDAAAARLASAGPAAVSNVTPESLVDAAAARLARAWAVGSLSDADGDALLRAARDGAAEANMRRLTGTALSALDGVPCVLSPRLAVAGVPSPASPPGQRFVCVSDASVVARARSAGLLPLAAAAWEPGAPGVAGGVCVPASHRPAAARAAEAAAAAGAAPPWVGTDSDAPRVTCLPGGGGVAAALAAGVGCAGVAADALGTARLAAAWTGTVAFLPSPGRLGRSGFISTIGARLDAPALAARGVADAGLLLGLLQEGEEEQGGRASAAAARVPRPPPPCPGAAALLALASHRPADLAAASLAHLVHVLLTGETHGAAGRAAGWRGGGGGGVGGAADHPPLTGLRVAVPEADGSGALLAPSAQAALRSAADALRAAGASVFPVAGPRFFSPAGVGAAHTLATAAALASARIHGAGDPTHPLPGLVLAEGAAFTPSSSTSPSSLAQAVAHAVCEARARAGAPPPGSPEVEAAARWARGVAARTARSLFADGTAHAVLAPAALGPAPTVADAAHAPRAWVAATDALAAPGTLGGLPTVVVRGGVCNETGLPVGVALHAGPGRDAVALACAVQVHGC